MTEEEVIVKRVLAAAEQFNEALSDARRASLIIEFETDRASYSDRVPEKVIVNSVYKSLHTRPRPIQGEDF